MSRSHCSLSLACLDIVVMVSSMCSELVGVNTSRSADLLTSLGISLLFPLLSETIKPNCRFRQWSDSQGTIQQRIGLTFSMKKVSLDIPYIKEILKNGQFRQPFLAKTQAKCLSIESSPCRSSMRSARPCWRRVSLKAAVLLWSAMSSSRLRWKSPTASGMLVKILINFGSD